MRPRRSNARGRKMGTEQPQLFDQDSGQQVEMSPDKPLGVVKSQKRTRRGKRGGVKRRLQLEKKLLCEQMIANEIRAIRLSMEGQQTNPSLSHDSVDTISMVMAGMTIGNSEPLYDYEYYFPEEVTQVNASQQYHHGTSPNTNNSTQYQPQYGYECANSLQYIVDQCYDTYMHGQQQECNSTYGYGYGYEYGCGNGYGNRYGNGCDGYGYV